MPRRVEGFGRLNESDRRIDEESHPRFPTSAPQHPKEGVAYFDVEAMVLKVYIGGEWVEIAAWRQ